MKDTKVDAVVFRGIASRLLQRLGLYKPPVKPLTPEDELWLFTNTAYRTPEEANRWKAEFVASYFRYDTGDKTAGILADIIEKLGIVEGEEMERRVSERVELFLNIIQPERTVELEFDAGSGQAVQGTAAKSTNKKSLSWPPSWWPGNDAPKASEPPPGAPGRLLLGPGGMNGISSNLLSIPAPIGESSYVDKSIVRSNALLPQGYGTPNGLENMETIFGEPTGWGVISDVDDTIKITKVLSRIEILRSTFALPSTPVPGMSEWYSRGLAPALRNPLWFYLSASPYNLYPMISKFINAENFPAGQLILRDMSWQEIEAFLYISLTVGTAEYKVDRITKIHSWFPQRKMILIGDSTQKDPEVYGEVYRKFGPEWVKGIFIRVVKGVDEKLEADLNKRERFEKAFEGVPAEGVWWTFEEPSEVEGIVESLVSVDEESSRR